MTFIEWELFHNKKKSLTNFKKDTMRFYCDGVVMTFIEREFFHDQRRNLTNAKSSLLILFAQSRGDIYWREALQWEEKELNCLPNFPNNLNLSDSWLN
jgi:hypothetical protein